MRRIAASVIAMACGWAVMNMVLFLLYLAAGEIPFHLGAMLNTIEAATPWLLISALVVMAAWLVVYLPVFALTPRQSEFWNWAVCLPCGAVVGAVVPFGIWVIPAVVKGHLEALIYLFPPALVGVVAAAVGRWLVDWSRHYQDLPDDGPSSHPVLSTRIGASNTTPRRTTRNGLRPSSP